MVACKRSAEEVSFKIWSTDSKDRTTLTCDQALFFFGGKIGGARGGKSAERGEDLIAG